MVTRKGYYDTYAKLDGGREVFTASLLLDGITTLNTCKEDKGRLDDSALALCGPQELLGKA